MTVPVDFYVEDVDERIAAGWTHGRVYSSATPFLNPFTSQVGSDVALVAGQRAYQVEDTDASPGPWYRWALYNEDTPAESAHSDPWRLDTSTLNEVMLAGAQLGGAAFASEAGAGSTETLLLDAALADNATGPGYLSNAWLFRPSASVADRLRRLKSTPYNVAASGLEPLRAWATPPSSGEAYQVYLLLPPFETAGQAYSWAAAARDGLQACEYEDKVWIGAGDGATTEFDLGAYLGMVKKIRRVWLERYNETTGAVIARVDADKQGRWFRTIPNGRGNLTLKLSGAPLTGTSVVIECLRRDSELYTPTDITSCPLRLAARATLWKAYEYLNRVQPGQYGSEVASAYQGWMREYSGQGDMPTAVVTA